MGLLTFINRNTDADKELERRKKLLEKQNDLEKKRQAELQKILEGRSEREEGRKTAEEASKGLDLSKYIASNLPELLPALSGARPENRTGLLNLILGAGRVGTHGLLSTLASRPSEELQNKLDISKLLEAIAMMQDPSMAKSRWSATKFGYNMGGGIQLPQNSAYLAPSGSLLEGPYTEHKPASFTPGKEKGQYNMTAESYTRHGPNIGLNPEAKAAIDMYNQQNAGSVPAPTSPEAPQLNLNLKPTIEGILGNILSGIGKSALDKYTSRPKPTIPQVDIPNLEEYLRMKQEKPNISNPGFAY